jgi:hypothetical protein
MENIIEPNDSFDFSKLSLAHPVGIQGGAYFTKIENNTKPLYIQTIKSQSRQGFVKTGKKYYMDIMFDKNAETLIQWFENLETRCQKLIFEKRDTWFQNGLEESDIESAFNSTIKIYKSGKFYLLRTNIKNNHNHEPTINIYDEHEIHLEMSNITPETKFISILEIQGIKFTTRNFQIEIEMKQIMVLDDEPLFDNCLIKTTKTDKKEKIVATETKPFINVELDDIHSDLFKNNIEEIQLEEMESGNNQVMQISCKNHLEELIPLEEEEKEEGEQEKEEREEEKSSNFIDLEIEDLTEYIEENEDSLKEVKDLDVSLTDIMQLKKPNQVYFELYKEARNKAKIAKKNAIIAYLEAKNIKKTYMLENLMDNSDSEFDDEIDEVSESELEGL